MARGAGGIEKGMSRRNAGALAIVVIGILVYFAFAKDIPFTQGHRIDMYVANANNVQPKNFVRIAGVNVGRVKSVERPKGSELVKLTLELEDRALPIHTDATAKIRPRMFLEGNNFIDLQPGSPSAPILKEGGSIPASQTETSTQLDQLLSALNRDARDGLASLFQEIGKSLDTVGTPEENKTQDPDVRHLTGGEALNRAMRYGPEGFKGGARVFDALVGFENGDQQAILKGLKEFSGAINDREAQIVPQIADFATTMGAFANDEKALQDATREFSRLAYESEPTLRNLNQMLPHLTTFARELAPQMKEVPETVRLAYPWIDETTKLLAENELGKTARLGRRTIGNFASVADESLRALPEFNRVAVCWTRNWEPALNTPIQDGIHSSGTANYKEFWYSLVGWAGGTQNFTGNGNFLRIAGGSAADIASPSGKYEGKSALPQLGTRPARPTKSPPIRTDVPCHKSDPPNLAPTAGSTP